MIVCWDECLGEFKHYFLFVYVVMQMQFHLCHIVLDFARLISNVISIAYVIVKFN
jgi:hypothetical protein